MSRSGPDTPGTGADLLRADRGGGVMALTVASFVFVAGLLLVAIWRVEDWRTAQRRKARFEARRSSVDEQRRYDKAFTAIVDAFEEDEEPTEEIDVTTLRTESIELPRDGEPK